MLPAWFPRCGIPPFGLAPSGAKPALATMTVARRVCVSAMFVSDIALVFKFAACAAAILRASREGGAIPDRAAWVPKSGGGKVSFVLSVPREASADEFEICAFDVVILAIVATVGSATLVLVTLSFVVGTAEAVGFVVSGRTGSVLGPKSAALLCNEEGRVKKSSERSLGAIESGCACGTVVSGSELERSALPRLAAKSGADVLPETACELEKMSPPLSTPESTSFSKRFPETMSGCTGPRGAGKRLAFRGPPPFGPARN